MIIDFTPEETYEILRKSTRLMDSIYGKGPFVGTKYADSALFVGDTHGSVDISKKILDEHMAEYDEIIFLGDYVDYGRYGLENLLFILNKFLINPEKIILLRGNHEHPLVNEYYGFKREVSIKIGPEAYRNFVDLFKKMPYAAVINGWFCVHGGLARNLTYVKEIESLPRNDVYLESEIAFELLWNDPKENISGFAPNLRGPGTYYFGEDVFLEFIENNALNGIIRGHEAVDGFRENFSGKMITVHSSVYHGVRPGIVYIRDGKIGKSYLNQ